jgi:hypothetical protein
MNEGEYETRVLPLNKHIEIRFLPIIAPALLAIDLPALPIAESCRRGERLHHRTSTPSGSAHGQRVSHSKSRTHDHDIQVLFACRAAREELEGWAEKRAVA